MKKFFALSVFSVLFSAQTFAAQVDPTLLAFSQGRTGQGALRVIAVLQTRPEGLPTPRRYDSVQVIDYLRALSSQAFVGLQSYLGRQPSAPTSIRVVSTYWINATVAADVTPAGLQLLARAPGVTKIYANRMIRREPDRIGRRTPRPTGGPADATFDYQFNHTDLAKLIRTEPQIDGRGVVLGQLDSGVDGTHPALAGKILKFWDARTKSLTQPVDTESHGTHTAGTMVGGDRTSLLIGVAPSARLVSAGAIGDFDQILAGMQFFLDPDGNPRTKDSPRTINNSWNCEGAPDVEVFYSAIGAWEAAGILPVFSAGNSGPGPRTITCPHEHPSNFAVASTSENGLVSDFSSRGPGIFRGTPTNKPDVSAPGDNIRSSLPGGQFGEMSGTSMSTPQVTGTTALLLQVDPSLTPEQIRKILINSSRPVDAGGQPSRARIWNANYGLGKLNIFDAVQLAKRVLDQRRRGGPNPLGQLALGEFFSQVEDWDAQEILREEPVSVDELIRFPAALEKSGDWISL